MKKEIDTLSELRQDYRDAKKELGKYDSFIDNHFAFCIFTPFILSLVMVIFAAINTLWWAGILSLVLFVISIAMLSLALFRSGRINKINARLDDIEHEVKLFHSMSSSMVAANVDRSITDRDELGLRQDIKLEDSTNQYSGKGGWAMGVIVIIAVASVISFNQANDRKQQELERMQQTQTTNMQRTKQQQDAIEQRKLDQQDEANRLQRQQNAIDLYDSTKPSSSYEYRSSTSCTSRAIGSTMYTDCN